MTRAEIEAMGWKVVPVGEERPYRAGHRIVRAENLLSAVVVLGVPREEIEVFRDGVWGAATA